MEDVEFTLTIELGNDMMRTGRDVARTLREVARRLEADYAGSLLPHRVACTPKPGGLQHTSYIERPLFHTESLRDVNGNRIGSFAVKPVGE